MIAEEGSRGKGLGKEAMTLMLNYGARKLGVRTFEARIKVSLIIGEYDWIVWMLSLISKSLHHT